MDHTFKPQKPILFPNNEIFYATVTIENEVCEWRIPIDVISDFKEKFNDSHLEDIISEQSNWINQRWINELLGFNSPIIQWRNSISYENKDKSIKLLEGNISNNIRILSKFNTKIDNHILNPVREIFSDYEIAFAVVYDKEIASICFSNKNKPLTIQSNPGYRNRGYGTICLSHYLNYCIENNYKCLYATDYINKSSRRIAEKVGLGVKSRMVWITIPTYARDSIPEIIETDLKKFTASADEESA